MQVRFANAATTDLTEAVRYYNGEREGLGYEFAAEIMRTVECVVAFPEAWPALSRKVRRARASRFPYGVLYQFGENRILVVAIMHMHRDPATWSERAK